MTFELIEKRQGRGSLEDDNVSFSKTGLTLGAGIFPDTTFLEVYLDPEGRRVGFKETDSSLTGFKVALNANAKNRRMNAHRIVEKLSLGLFKAVKEKDMWIVKDIEIAQNDK